MGLFQLVPDEDIYGDRESGYSGEPPKKGMVEWTGLDASRMSANTRATYELQGKNIISAAKMARIDPVRLLAHMTQESGGKADSVGALVTHKDGTTENALGTMQVLPSTAADLGFSAEDLKDPLKGTLAGAMYIRYLDDYFDGNLLHSTSAYFDGLGNVEEHVKEFNTVRTGKGNVDYLNKVFGYYSELRDLPEDIAAFTWPDTDGKPRSTGGNLSRNDPATQGGTLHTPSELRTAAGIIGGPAGSGFARIEQAYFDLYGDRAPTSSWYKKLEDRERVKNGMLAQVPDEYVYEAHAEDMENIDDSKLEGLRKSFMHGLTTSATSVGVAVGGFGKKLGLPGAEQLLDSSLAGTSALDEYYQVKDPDFWNTLASGFGSTVPLLVTAIVSGGAASWLMATKIGMRLSTRFAASAVANNALSTLLARTTIKGAAKLGMKGLTGKDVVIATAANLGFSSPEAAMEAGSVYKRVLDEGGTDDEAYKASSQTFWANEGLLLATNAPFIGKMMKGWKWYARLVTGASLEAYQEMLQENISMAALDEKDWSGTWIPTEYEAGAVGFIIGGFMHGGQMAYEASKNTVSDPSEDIDIPDGDGNTRTVRSAPAMQFSLPDVEEIMGGHEPQAGTEEEFGNTISVKAQAMGEAELKRELNNTNARVVELENTKTLGTPENLEIEKRRLGIQLNILAREVHTRNMIEAFDESGFTTDELDRTVNQVLRRNDKRGGVTRHEMQQTLVALNVLGRKGALTEKTLAAFTGAFPVYRNALDAFRQNEAMNKAAEQRGDEAPLPKEGAPVKAPPTAAEPVAAEPKKPAPAKAVISPKGRRITVEDGIEVTDVEPVRKPAPAKAGAAKPKTVSIPISKKEKSTFLPTSDPNIAYVPMSNLAKAALKKRGFTPVETIPTESAKAAERVTAIAKLMGIRVLWGRNNDVKAAVGKYMRKEKIALLNISKIGKTPTAAIDFVLSHELGHHISRTTKLRPLMRDLLSRVSARSTTLQSKIDGKRRSYETAGLTEEVIADLLAYEIVNPEQEALILKHLTSEELGALGGALKTFLNGVKLRRGEDPDSAALATVLEDRLNSLVERLDVLSKLDAKYRSIPLKRSGIGPVKHSTRKHALLGVKKGYYTKEQLDELDPYVNHRGLIVYANTEILAMMTSEGRAELKLGKSEDPEYREEIFTHEERIARQKKADERAQAKAKKKRIFVKKPSRVVRTKPLSRKIKIISGGQTGADRGGIEGAAAIGLETGGVAPKGYRTETGRERRLEELGLTESKSAGYADRTLQNVLAADVTALFGDMKSPGSMQTIKMAVESGKPYIVNPNGAQLNSFINAHKAKVVNIAGNRQSKKTGASDAAYIAVIEAFQITKTETKVLGTNEIIDLGARAKERAENRLLGRRSTKQKPLTLTDTQEKKIAISATAETPEGRERIEEAIQVLREKSSEVRDRMRSGTRPLGSGIPAVKRSTVRTLNKKTGKYRIRIVDHITLDSYGRGFHELRWTDSDGMHNIETFSYKQAAIDRMNKLKDSKLTPQEADRRLLNNIDQDIEGFRAALNRVESIERTEPSVEEAFAVDKQLKNLTNEQKEVLGGLKTQAEGLAEERAALKGADKLAGERPFYRAEEGENLEARTEAEDKEEIARSLRESYLTMTEAINFIKDMSESSGIDVGVDILETDAIDKVDEGTDRTTKYSMDDLMSLYGAVRPTTEQLIKLSYAVARGRLDASIEGVKRSRASAEVQYDRSAERLSALDDYEWLRLFRIAGLPMKATDVQQDGSQTEKRIQWGRENLIEAAHELALAEDMMSKNLRKIEALDKAKDNPVGRIADLRIRLNNQARKYLKAVENSNDAESARLSASVYDIQEELAFLAGLDITDSSDLYSSITQAARLVSNLGYEKVKGKQYAQAPRVISSNATVQAAHENNVYANELKLSARDRAERKKNEAYNSTFDDNHLTKIAIEQAFGGREARLVLARGGIDLYTNLRTLPRTANRVIQLSIEETVRSFEDESVEFSPGLRKIVQKYGLHTDKAKRARLGLFMTAKRLVQQYNYDSKRIGLPGTDRAKVREYMKEQQEIYDELGQEEDLISAAREISGFNIAMLDLLHEAGVKSDDDVRKLKEQLDEFGELYYSPVYKADRRESASLANDDIGRDAEKGIRAMGIIDIDAIIMDPIEASLRNVSRYTRIAYSNRTKSLAADMMAQPGGDVLGYEIELDPTSLNFRSSQEVRDRAASSDARPMIVAKVEEAIVYYGMPTEMVEQITDEILTPQIGEPLGPDAEKIKLFISSVDLGDNMIAFLRRGELKVLKILDQDILNSFANMKGEAPKLAIRLAGAMTKWLKEGATRTLEFAGRNIIRDSFGNAIGSTGMISNPAELAEFSMLLGKGISHSLKQVMGKAGTSEEEIGLIIHGGALGEFMGLGDNHIKEATDNMMRSLTNNRDKFPMVWHWYKRGIASTESVNRVAVYTMRKNQIRDANPGLPEHIVSRLAAFDSRDAGVDFARTGKEMGVINTLMPFFTASLGGTDKMTRSLFGKNATKGAWARGIMLLTLPTLALHSVNYDKDWYIAQPSWKKNLFWLIKMGDHIISIPKPFEYGLIFASLPERIWDAMFAQDPGLFESKNFTSMLMAQMYGGSLTGNAWVFGLVPAVSNIGLSQLNYDPFRQQDIVKGVRAELEAPYQYSDSTSDFFRWLAMFAHERGITSRLSPAKLDFYVRSSFGGLGQDVVKGLSFLTRKITKDPAYQDLIQKDWYDSMPIIRGFSSRDTGAFGRWSDQFYEMYRDAERAHKTHGFLADRRGDIKGVKRELEINGGLAALYPGMLEIAEMGKRVTIAIDGIKMSDQYTPLRRREMIEELNVTRGELYRMGILMVIELLPETSKAARKAAQIIKLED